jgi:hypothetical protein
MSSFISVSTPRTFYLYKFLLIKRIKAFSEITLTVYSLFLRFRTISSAPIIVKSDEVEILVSLPFFLVSDINVLNTFLRFFSAKLLFIFKE